MPSAFDQVENDFRKILNHPLLFLRKQKIQKDFGSSSGLSNFLSLPITTYYDSGKDFKKLLKGLTAAGTAPDFPDIGSTGFSFNSVTGYVVETKIEVKVRNFLFESDRIVQFLINKTLVWDDRL